MVLLLVAVMKMCDILHARHRNLFLRANWLFNLTNLAKQQSKLLGIIHGLTTKVIRSKKNAFITGARGSLAKTEINTKGFGQGIEEFRTTTTVEGLSYGQSAGLKDDLDVDNDAEDIGEKKRLAFLDLLLESAQNGALITDKGELCLRLFNTFFHGINNNHSIYCNSYLTCNYFDILLKCNFTFV